MPLELKKVSVDTPISGSPTLNLLLAPLNYAVDFAVVQDTPGEVKISNVTCPTDRPELMRFAVSEVRDIYKGANIDPNLYTPSRRGVSLVVGLSSVYSITDTANASYTAAVPISGHIVLKMPNNQLLTGQMIKDFLARLTDGMFNTGVVDTTRLQSLFRGSLRPKGM